MRWRTKDNLLWIFTVLACIGLGIFGKFAFDTSWWAAPVFGFGWFIGYFLVFQTLDIIDNIMRYFQNNKKLREEKEELQKDRQREYEKLNREYPCDVRWRMVDQIFAEAEKKKRLEYIENQIKGHTEEIKKLEAEIELYKQLAEQEGGVE